MTRIANPRGPLGLNLILVFGSNLAGRHGKGAAKYALSNKGAVYGVAEGLQGESYAIPTKDENLRPLGLDQVDTHIARFVFFARDNPDLLFALTPIGTGLAGFSKRQIWSSLARYRLPENVLLTSTWVNEP